MQAPQDRHSLDIDGRRLAWRSLGSSSPLLLINGYAATAEDWDPQLLECLTRSFRLICPDNRGMGESELGDPAELTIDAMAGDLEALCGHLEIDRLAVAGWSMGGYVAQQLTARAPRLVSALVLLATAPGGSAAIAAEPRSWQLLTDHSGTPREQATRLIALLFPPDVAAEIDRQFGEVVAAARAKLSVAALDAQEAAMTVWQTQAQAPAPADAPPALIVCGSEDVVIPSANAEVLAAHWPGSRVQRFTGGGHAFMAQEPQRLAALIEDFVS